MQCSASRGVENSGPHCSFRQGGMRWGGVEGLGAGGGCGGGGGAGGEFRAGGSEDKLPPLHCGHLLHSSTFQLLTALHSGLHSPNLVSFDQIQILTFWSVKLSRR